MNIIIRKNIKIIFYGLLYLLISILFIYNLSIPVILKILFIIIINKNIIFTIIVYLLLVCNNKTIIPFVSDIIFNHYFNTRHNFHITYNKPPCIFITNYPYQFYNYFAIQLLPQHTIFVGGTSKFFGFGLLSNKYYPLQSKTHFEQLQAFIKTSNKNNFNIVAFADEIHTNEKTEIYKIGRIKTGIFTIAKNLGIPIVPIAICAIDYDLGIPDTYNHHIYAGKSFYVKDIEKSRTFVKKFLKKYIRPRIHNL